MIRVFLSSFIIINLLAFYHNILANKMMELLRQTADSGSLVDKTLTGGSGQDQKTYQVKLMDDFSYKDPILLSSASTDLMCGSG